MTLNHVARGAGAPLVAIHGFNVDHRMMLPLVEPLFGTDVPVRRLYPDLPGMGESPGGGIDSADDVADALDAWLAENVGDEPFLLVGLSFGGYLARELCRRRPEQVRGLALLVPVAEPDKEKRRTPDHEPIEVDEDFLAALEESDGAAAVKEFEEMAVVQTPQQYAAFRDQIVPGLRAADQDTLDRINDAYALSGLPETQPWDGPALVVCGRQDAIVGWRDQADLLESYPRATFAVLDRAGHNVHLEAPEQTQALLSAWVQRCDADRPVAG